MSKKTLLSASAIRSTNLSLAPDSQPSDEESSTLSQEKESFPPHDDNTNEEMTGENELLLIILP
jgi:hypothetical protein